MPFLFVDTLNGGACTAMAATELDQIPDDKLEACLNGEATIVRWSAEDSCWESLEFVNDLIPNWVQVPCE